MRSRVICARPVSKFLSFHNQYRQVHRSVGMPKHMGVAMALHEESKFSARKKAIVLLGLSAIGWGIVVWVMTEAVTLMYAIYSVVHGAHQ